MQPTNNNAQLYSGNKLTSGGASDPLLPKLVQAINHASEIEISVSFIQPSGLNLLFDPILDALKSGASLKLLTSDYLSITSPVALRQLMLLVERGAQCRMFECKGDKSFHMKSYIFVRTQNGETVEGCAWVGSNNISKTALLESHEWALRHDYELPHDSKAALEFRYIRQQFDAIFTHPSTCELSHHWIDEYIVRHEQAKAHRPLVPVNGDTTPEEIEPPTPNSIQELALSALHQSRQQGYQRGLVVLATGMGKTWLSAFDARQINAKTVLFVAHREEILMQAEKTFSLLTPNAHTGLYNAASKDAQAPYLFASISTLGKEEHLVHFAPDHFDYIVVDEFHHASAPTYKALLAHFQPKFLLGLTATPERSDQADILSLCDNNLVFERNLVHGIDEKILVPFHYYGIHDSFVDYKEIPWRNGKFDPASLDNAFATKQRANHIFEHWQEKRQQRTLAFCVSKSHADYMAAQFNAQGIAAVAVYSDSDVRRNEALDMLNRGDVEVVFSVDLFNEGTDLPSIDTVLMIRPTESKILFLQQLGRGLRQSPQTGKQHLVVLDFIGNHEAFLNRPATLLNASGTKDIVEKLQGKPTLADGCFINFDPTLVNFWETLAKKIRASATDDYNELKLQLAHRPTATEFFHHGFDLAKVRKQETSWFNLVAKQEQDEPLTSLLKHHGEFLLRGLETTAMSKCFKAILLEALLELDGFRTPPTLEALAERSYKALSRRPDLRDSELPEKVKAYSATDKGWLSYWKGNPIKAYAEPNKSGEQWFKVENNHFVPTFSVSPTEVPQFHDLVQELVDLRLAQYIARVADKAPEKNTDASADIVPITRNEDVPQGTALPFYPDLKIACGHFKSGSHESAETTFVPDGYGKLDPSRHFVAPASGNSMNGGKNPIWDGDMLLLEWVTPDSAGSISNITMAIETQDDTGDNQYLLRVVRKTGDGQYELEAQNPDYKNMAATDNMRTFARLKAVIR